MTKLENLRLEDVKQFHTFIKRVHFAQHGITDKYRDNAINDVLSCFEQLRLVGGTCISLTVDKQEITEITVKVWREDTQKVTLSEHQEKVLHIFARRAAETYNLKLFLQPPGGGWTCDIHFKDNMIEVASESYLYIRQTIFQPDKSFNFMCSLK